MEQKLGEHFKEEFSDLPYRFVLSTVRPTSNRADLVVALAEFMARNKSDPQVTKDLVEKAGWASALASLDLGRNSVRRGDFGEVLATEAAVALDGMVVPVRKLRYQIDPNQTLPGTDVVGFLMSGNGEIAKLAFIESKYRSNPPADIAVEGHEQLTFDRSNSYATTVNFLANRLKELNPALYDSFMQYLQGPTVMVSRHTVTLTCDKDNWRDEIAGNLDCILELLPELALRVIHLESAGLLIDETYARLKWDVMGDG